MVVRLVEKMLPRGFVRLLLIVISTVFTRVKTPGVHAGVVTGTLCDEQLQGDYKEKRIVCLHCNFYQMVREEEIPLFSVTSVILDRKKMRKVELTDSHQHSYSGSV